MPRSAGTAKTAPGKRASNRREATINLRISAKERDLIDSAAEVAGKTRTEFVIESARKQAIDTLLDQRFFELDPQQWDAFTRALENPPAPNAALKKLLASKGPWEDG